MAYLSLSLIRRRSAQVCPPAFDQSNEREEVGKERSFLGCQVFPDWPVWNWSCQMFPCTVGTKSSIAGNWTVATATVRRYSITFARKEGQIESQRKDRRKAKAIGKEGIVKSEAPHRLRNDRASTSANTQFDISRITKVPVKFDIKQLDFLNRLCLKKRWKVAQSI